MNSSTVIGWTSPTMKPKSERWTAKLSSVVDVDALTFGPPDAVDVKFEAGLSMAMPTREFPAPARTVSSPTWLRLVSERWGTSTGGRGPSRAGREPLTASAVMKFQASVKSKEKYFSLGRLALPEQDQPGRSYWDISNKYQLLQL